MPEEGRGKVLLEILGGVPIGSPNSDPILDQTMYFPKAVFKPGH